MNSVVSDTWLKNIGNDCDLIFFSPFRVFCLCCVNFVLNCSFILCVVSFTGFFNCKDYFNHCNRIIYVWDVLFRFIFSIIWKLDQILVVVLFAYMCIMHVIFFDLIRLWWSHLFALATCWFYLRMRAKCYFHCCYISFNFKCHV